MSTKFRWGLILFIVACISSCKPYQNLQSFKYNQEIYLSGVVSSIKQEKGSKVSFIFHSYKYGDIFLRANKSYKHYIIPANKLDLQAKLYKPNEYENVNSFNYSEYLDHKGIIAIGNVIENSQIDYKGTAIGYLPERYRYYLNNFLVTEIKGYQSAPLILALLIGKRDFTQKEQNLFIDSGTSHLMVISGLHIGLLALIAFVLLRILWSSSLGLCRKIPAQYISAIFSLIVAFSYSLLAGFSLPTQRAVIMLAVVIILWLFNKKISLFRALGLAFLIILLLDYKTIYSTSLWLSFSAVMFLAFIAVIMQQYSSKLALNLLPQIYLAILLTPISVYYFSGFSLVSIFANLIAIPLVGFIIVPLLLFSLISAFLGFNLWYIPDFLLNTLQAYLSFLTKQVKLVEYWSHFSIISLFIVLAGLIMIILPLRKPFRLLGIAMCLVFFQPFENLSKEKQVFYIHIFDTKEIMVLAQDNGISILYTSEKNLSNKYVIDNFLSKYMKATGINKIDYLIVTGKKESLKLSELKKIVPIHNVITNIDSQLPNTRKCSYSNNFLLGNLFLKFLPEEGSCSVEISFEDREFLILGNLSKQAESQTYNLYGRTIAPIAVISSSFYRNLITKFKLNFYIYISNMSINQHDYTLLQNQNTRLIDTDNNGAITISIDGRNHMSITSTLKHY